MSSCRRLTLVTSLLVALRPVTYLDRLGLQASKLATVCLSKSHTVHQPTVLKINPLSSQIPFLPDPASWLGVSVTLILQVSVSHTL